MTELSPTQIAEYRAEKLRQMPPQSTETLPELLFVEIEVVPSKEVEDETTRH